MAPDGSKEMKELAAIKGLIASIKKLNNCHQSIE
jgi:hypothetical protein